ncbi:MAG: efflux RND transporter periplasmic adaptor subunit [Verrucomicrobia subdivision 3 bacterium]|nr:efflux RND transporter periplasmic adaptor subunit [Limisphaerales bacterium]
MRNSDDHLGDESLFRVAGNHTVGVPLFKGDWPLDIFLPVLLVSPPVDRRLFVLIALLSGVSCQRQSEPLISGTIEVDEVHIGSRYGGRVEQVFAREGDSLTNGQVIVALEAAELRAAHDNAAAQLAELKAGAREQEIAAAKNDWQALKAELQNATAEAARARELFKDNTIAESERDRLVSRAATLERSTAAAKSRYELLLAGTRAERIAQAEARVAEIEAQLREMRITAPTNAILEVLSVKPGDVVGPNHELATLLLPDHLWVRVYVPQPWLGHLQLGQKVRVKVDAFPDRQFEGEIEQISRIAEFTPRNTQTVAERTRQVFGVKIRLPSADGSLRAGMAADVTFPGVRRP